MKNVDDIYGLTPMQRLMLVYAVTHPEADVLVNPVAYEIRGDLDVSALRLAWRALVDRHPALRTAVLWQGLDRPVQVVRSRVDLPFREVDLSDLESTERDERFDALWREEASQPFDLGTAPLMRCTLVRMDTDRHLLLWCVHHLVIDRWSESVLSSDLVELYRALLVNGPPRLPPPVAFREYVGWLASRDPETAEQFWRDELGGLAAASLLTSKEGPIVSRDRRVARRALGRAATEALERAAGRWRVPLGSVVLAALGLAVARRLRVADVVVGLTVSGRPSGLDRVEEIVGSFVNDVPARMRIDRNALLADWLRGIARAQVARSLHEHTSLAEIREGCTLPAGEALFDVLVVMNLGEVPRHAGPLDLRAVAGVLDSAHPLTLGISRGAEGLELELVHRFDPAWADTLADEFATSLSDLANSSADAEVGSLVPPLTPVEATVGRARPSDPMEVKPAPGDLATLILTVWRDVLGVDELGLDDDFFALGGTSLAAARIFSRIERETGRALPLSLLVDATSVRSLVAALDGSSAPAPAGPLVTLRSGGRGHPVFAVPGIGGGVVGLLPLARALPSGRAFHAFQSRGYDGTEEPLRTISAIAADFVAALPRDSGRPFHLLGACWGAAVAFEMARLLGAEGRAPQSLSLVDPPTILLEQDTSATSGPRTGFVSGRIRLYWDEFREGDWTERRDLVARKARAASQVLRRGGISGDTRTEMGRTQVRAANQSAIEQYSPTPASARARIFLAQDRDVPASRDPRREWVARLDPEPAVVLVPGFDSGNVLTENVEPFAASLRDWLVQAESV